MSKKIVFLIMALTLLLGLIIPVSALSNEQHTAIQSLLEDARRISGAPGISVSILIEDEVFFFSSGYANRAGAIQVDETTLFELASLSKAFTGLGVLLLEQQGFLSLDDSIVEYLPWFTLQYRGRPIDMQYVTLNHFLHHTSGIVNSRHTDVVSPGSTPDMLQKTVESTNNAELAFQPGTRFEYGTVNYDILGLVIEVVLGQSFEDFMEEQVFRPLGLNQTFANRNRAKETGQLAQGYRLSFFITMPHDL